MSIDRAFQRARRRVKREGPPVAVVQWSDGFMLFYPKVSYYYGPEQSKTFQHA